jgi:hypothetical protein
MVMRSRAKMRTLRNGRATPNLYWAETVENRSIANRTLRTNREIPRTFNQHCSTHVRGRCETRPKRSQESSSKAVPVVKTRTEQRRLDATP